MRCGCALSVGVSKLGHMPTPTRDILTVAQAAAELGITRRAVLHRITAGTITAEKIGSGQTSAYVITRAEVDRCKAIPAA